MDLRQLGYFVSVAEFLNFTKAAQHHYVAQTAISQQIMALEKLLEVKLFDRNNRSVVLTSAGKVFYKEAKLILARSEEAIDKTRRTANGYEGNLRIGFQGAHQKKLLPRLIKAFRKSYPSIDLTITQDNVQKLCDSLSNGILDVIFNAVEGIEKVPGAEWKTLTRQPVCVVVYLSHPLANRNKIHRSALAHETFVAVSRSEASGPYDKMIQDCVRSGFTPNIVAHARLVEAVLIMVEAEIGIALMPKHYKVYSSENLRFIELEGENIFLDSAVAWMSNNDNPALPLFLTQVDEVMAQNTSSFDIYP